MTTEYPRDVIIAAYARMRAEGDTEACKKLRELAAGTQAFAAGTGASLTMAGAVPPKLEPGDPSA